MAEKPEVNRSQAIRDYYKKNPNATAQEALDALAKEGVTVNAGLIYAVRSKQTQRLAAKQAAKSEAKAKTQGVLKATEKTPEVNKTRAVRDYLKEHRNASSDEVVDALKAQKITVSASLVRNVKSKSKRRRRAVREAVAAAGPTGIGVPEIKAALSFIKTMGSVEVAKQALAAAVEIRKVV